MQTLSQEEKIQLLQALQNNPIIRRAVEFAKAERAPGAFDPNKDKDVTAVALKSAHRQGFMEGLDIIYEIAAEREQPDETPFLDTSKN